MRWDRYPRHRRLALAEQHPDVDPARSALSRTLRQWIMGIAWFRRRSPALRREDSRGGADDLDRRSRLTSRMSAGRARDAAKQCVHRHQRRLEGVNSPRLDCSQHLIDRPRTSIRRDPSPSSLRGTASAGNTAVEHLYRLDHVALEDGAALTHQAHRAFSVQARQFQPRLPPWSPRAQARSFSSSAGGDHASDQVVPHAPDRSALSSARRRNDDSTLLIEPVSDAPRVSEWPSAPGTQRVRSLQAAPPPKGTRTSNCSLRQPRRISRRAQKRGNTVEQRSSTQESRPPWSSIARAIVD